MDRKIRVGAVSYLNAKPLTYGFEKGNMMEEVELIFDYPSRLAAMLQSGEIDVGLVPVVTISALKEYHIISDYGIGANGPVASVSLFSEVPVREIKNILLDYQSRTSVALLKLLLDEYWHISPVLAGTMEGYEKLITGTTAGLIIGDRTLTHFNKFPYTEDLAMAWKKMTGLPFLFAAWIANKELPENFIRAFNKTTGEGLDHIGEIVASNPFPNYNLTTYFTKNIDYRLDEEKRKAMKLFLNSITALNLPA